MKQYIKNYKILGIALATMTIAVIMIDHTAFWFTGQLSEGDHIAKDFHEGGLSFQIMERVIGFFIAGIPIGLFVICLVRLVQFFYNHPSVALLKKSSEYAIWGAISLALYPTILSFIFIATASLENRMVIFSLQPVVVLILIISGLFASMVNRLHTHSHEVL